MLRLAYITDLWCPWCQKFCTSLSLWVPRLRRVGAHWFHESANRSADASLSASAVAEGGRGVIGVGMRPGSHQKGACVAGGSLGSRCPTLTLCATMAALSVRPTPSSVAVLALFSAGWGLATLSCRSKALSDTDTGSSALSR